MASRQREKLEYIERHVVLNFSNGGGSVDAINNKPRLNYLKKVRKEEKKLGLRDLKRPKHFRLLETSSWSFVVLPENQEVNKMMLFIGVM